MKQKTFLISICIIVSVFFILFCISSCTDGKVKGNAKDNAKSKQNAVSQESSFPKNVSVELDDFSFKATIYKSDNGDKGGKTVTTIKVLSPKTLEGMEFQYDGKSLTATFLGISMQLDKNSKLVKEILKLL